MTMSKILQEGDLEINAPYKSITNTNTKYQSVFMTDKNFNKSFNQLYSFRNNQIIQY